MSEFDSAYSEEAARLARERAFRTWWDEAAPALDRGVTASQVARKAFLAGVEQGRMQRPMNLYRRLVFEIGMVAEEMLEGSASEEDLNRAVGRLIRGTKRGKYARTILQLFSEDYQAVKKYRSTPAEDGS